MQIGGHAMFVACGSGTADYPAVDDTLGLVTALLHSGASSVVSTAWNTALHDASRWTMAYGQACRQERLRVEQAGDSAEIDLLRCSQAATRHLIDEEGKAAIVSWAGFMHSGYWSLSIPAGDGRAP